MRDKIYYILISSIVAASVALLALTVVEYRRQQSSTERKAQIERNKKEDLPVRLTTLFEGLQPANLKGSEFVPRDSTTDYLVLFLVSSKVCTPCIHEVHEYIDLLGTVVEASVQPVLVVAESDTVAGKYFLEIAGYNTPSFVGLSTEINRIATLLDGETPVYQLLAFIDLESEMVVQRNILPTRLTSESDKIRNITEVLSNQTVTF